MKYFILTLITTLQFNAMAEVVAPTKRQTFFADSCKAWGNSPSRFADAYKKIVEKAQAEGFECADTSSVLNARTHAELADLNVSATLINCVLEHGYSMSATCEK